MLNNSSRYARERAAEEPLVQASSNPTNLPVSEFPTKNGGGARSPRPIKSRRELEINEKRHEDSVKMPHLPGRERGVGSEARCFESELPARLQPPAEIQRNFDAAAWGCKRICLLLFCKHVLVYHAANSRHRTVPLDTANTRGTHDPTYICLG